MVDVMNAVFDEILKSVQTRLATVEMQVSETRDEVSELRSRLEATCRDVVALQRAQAGIASRLDRVERRLDATDLPLNDA